MLQIKGLGKAFRGEWLFRSLDFHINERDRIALVGDNGAGKSTLMKIIAGLIAADEGEIVGSRDLTFGYLPQDGQFVHGRRLMQEVLSIFQPTTELEHELRRLEVELSELRPESSAYQKKLERYELVSQQFRLRDGYSLEAKAGSVLIGLGFKQNDFDRPCTDFSGGWQMRIALAKLLLQQPRLLLLDEPTNHLDLEARNWLEDFLRSYPYALILVSHDRFFLDATVERVLEIRNRAVHFYQGSYTDFLRQREERLARVRAEYRAQQKEIARIKAFAEKFRSKATKAAQVQSRLKELERMKPVEVPPEAKTIHLRFPKAPHSGRIVIELKNVTAGYGDTPVFKNLNYQLERGERVAVVGPNGAGKSTLIKILAGRLPLIDGIRKEGHNVVVSYFSQDQSDLLSSGRTVWEEVYSIAAENAVPQLRTLLGCFLFSGDDIDKPVSILSGGERSRLMLCKLLLSPANCLLLDEPTNHLDIKSKDILMDALADYEGTLVFVSHDRYFLDGLATKILEVGNQTVVPYLGNYEDYLVKKTSLDNNQEGSAEGGGEEIISRRQDQAMDGGREAKKRKVNPYRIQQITAQIEQIERQIQAHEERMGELAKMLASGVLYRDPQRLRSILDEHNRLQAELNQLMAGWEQLQSALEALKN